MSVVDSEKSKIGAAQKRHAEVKKLFMELCEASFASRNARFKEMEPEVAAEVRSLLEHMSTEPLLAAPVQEANVAADNTAENDPLKILGQWVDERYRVEEFVAEGGFSYVYRAEQIRWKRPVALKFFKLNRAHDAEVRDAFVKEGALLAQLSQQTTAIVQSYDIGEFIDDEDENHLFMALEWLHGRTLAELFKAQKACFSYERLFELLDPIAHGLGVAHQSGIAHRDVKPSNIFIVEKEEKTLTSKLLDFGVAKVASENEQGFEGTGGTLKAFTLGYGAPEQIVQGNTPTGPWTDVYSLALVATELLSGRRIVDGNDPMSAMKRLNQPELNATPRAMGAKVSRGVEQVFKKALSPKAADRYADVQIFWDAFKGAVKERKFFQF